MLFLSTPAAGQTVLLTALGGCSALMIPLAHRFGGWHNRPLAYCLLTGGIISWLALVYLIFLWVFKLDPAMWIKAEFPHAVGPFIFSLAFFSYVLYAIKSTHAQALKDEFARGRADEKAVTEQAEQRRQEAAEARKWKPATAAENMLFGLVRRDYNALNFAQKLTLRIICLNPGISEFELLIKLQNMGIMESKKTIIDPLLRSPLIHHVRAQAVSDDCGEPATLSTIEVESGKAPMVWRLIEENPLC